MGFYRVRVRGVLACDISFITCVEPRVGHWSLGLGLGYIGDEWEIDRR